MGNSNSDSDRRAADLRALIAACQSGGSVILLLAPATELPPGWAAPWQQAGWKTRDCMQLDEFSSAQDQEKWLTVMETGSDRLPAPVPAAVPEPDVDRRHGRLRRSDFLAELAREIRAPLAEWTVLMAIRVDQAAALSGRLGQAAAYELEQRIAERFSVEFEEADVYSIWLEFGFGVLVRRDHSEQVTALAERLCASVAREPFDAAGEASRLTVSIGLALPPRGSGADNPDRWFASAHAAQGIALRHGGNCHDGVLNHEFDGMPAERVLIIREWVREAVTGQNILIEFQPLQPLQPNVDGLYMVHAKLRDYRAPLGGVYRNEFLSLAREAGAMTMIDRVSLFEAFGALDQIRASGRRTRMLVPIEMATLDGDAWTWLKAELHRHRHLPDVLIVQVEATPALIEPKNRALLARVRQAGAAVALADRTGGLDWIPLWSQIPANFLRLPVAVVTSVPTDEFAARASLWLDAGRGLIVDEVANLVSLRKLATLGIDYLQGQAVAGSGPRPDFEFDNPPPA